MIQRWTSDPIPIQIGAGGVSRIDLEFEAIDHSGSTFTVLAYLNNQDVPDDAGRDDEQNFAGAFTVFAHGDCWGDIGHCEPSRDPASEFDLRPEHALTPANFTLDITDAVMRLARSGPLETVEVTTLVTGEPDASELPLLRFDALTLVVYEAVSTAI